MQRSAAPPLLTDPTGHLLGLLATGPQRILIGIAGAPGSGKTTFAARLAADIRQRARPEIVTTLGMDGYHLTKAQLAALPDPQESLIRRGAPWTFDAAAMANKLQEVRTYVGSKGVFWPDFQHGAGDPVADALSVDPRVRIVIVEGLYLCMSSYGWAPVSALFDERWFLDTPLELSLERLAIRHMNTRNITRQEAWERIERNDRLNAAIVSETRQFSDWRVQ